ncbi:Synembryn-A Protein [Collichthys lucidus]|uniref:Synembryn n=1 Tax=Collichthys lucidus TaxID=240159 RepID=A0A4U5UIP6_COLLU|nr:Synembryn-A Protein [Collichthys lucidus]
MSSMTMKMDLNGIIEQMESGGQDTAMTALQSYNQEMNQCFTFSKEEKQNREHLGELVLSFLNRELQPSCQLACLETVRILSRDKHCLHPFISHSAMSTLAHYAGIALASSATPASRQPDDQVGGGGEGEEKAQVSSEVVKEASPSSENPDQDIIVEGLKSICNILLHCETGQEEAAAYRHLGAILRHCLMSHADGEKRTEEFYSHTVNLLGNLPLPCLDVLLMPKVQQGSIEYMGVNMDAVNMLLKFMEKRLDRGHKLKETLLPSLNLLTESARIHRETRKFLRSKVRLRFIKYTGYGNAAGLLAARGLLRGGRDSGIYSEDEDSETEEYKEAKAQSPNPMDGMTEEQKEYEAMKLVEMFDKLSRYGVIQPMQLSMDGRMEQMTPENLNKPSHNPVRRSEEPANSGSEDEA